MKRKKQSAVTNQAEVEIELDEMDVIDLEQFGVVMDDDELELFDDSEIEQEEPESLDNDEDDDLLSDDEDFEDGCADEQEDEEDEEVEPSVTKESDEEENIEELEFDELKPSAIKQITRTVDKGDLTIVNSKNGKRIAISSKVQKNLQNPSEVQIGYLPDSIVIANNLGDTHKSFTLKKSGLKGLIYSSGLVKEITKLYELDFSNRTSITFSDAIYRKTNGNIVALIKVK